MGRSRFEIGTLFDSEEDKSLCRVLMRSGAPGGDTSIRDAVKNMYLNLLMRPTATPAVEWKPIEKTLPVAEESSQKHHGPPPSSHQLDSLLWYLSMIVHDRDMMHTAARLYFHLVAQVERARAIRLQELEALQMNLEKDMALFLEAADASSPPGPSMSGASHHKGPHSASSISSTASSTATTGSCMVRHRTTANVIARHQEQLAALQRRHEQEDVDAVISAQRSFASFLQTAAPQYLQKMTSPSRGNVSHNTADAPPSTQAPPLDDDEVVVFKVVNPLRGSMIGARPKDPSLAPIIFETSPLRQLRQRNALSFSCVASEMQGPGHRKGSLRRHSHQSTDVPAHTPPPSSGSDVTVISVGEEEREAMFLKVQDHLCRVASSRYSMLIIVVPAATCNEEATLAENATFLRSIGVYGPRGCCSGEGERTFGDPRAPQFVSAPELIFPFSVKDASCDNFEWMPLRGSSLSKHIEWTATTTVYCGNVVVQIHVPPPPSRAPLDRHDEVCGSRTLQPLWHPQTFFASAFRDVFHFALSRSVSKVSVAVRPDVGDMVFTDGQLQDVVVSPGKDAVCLSGKAWVLRGIHDALAHVQLEGTSLLGVGGGGGGKHGASGGAGGREEHLGSGAALSVSRLLSVSSSSNRTKGLGSPTPTFSESVYAASSVHPLTSVPCTPVTVFNTPFSVKVYLGLGPSEPMEASAAEAFGRDVEVIGRSCCS